MAVAFHTHTFEIPTATDAEVAAGVRSDVAVVPSNLGTAAQSDVGEFATAAQGTLADTAVQPGDLGDSAGLDVGTTAGTVAAGDDSRITGAAQKSANLSDLADVAVARTNLGLGSAAVEDTSAFATAAQGALADAALPKANVWFKTEKDFGGVSDNVTDDSAAVQDLVDWAMVDPKRRKAVLLGQVFCASDITNFHDIRWDGAGSVRIGTGSDFYPNPNNRNRGFSGLGYNEIWIDPLNGNDANSGLATEFPIKTCARNNQVMCNYGGYMPGYWRTKLKEGVYTETLVSFLFVTQRGAPWIIDGPAVAAGWNNSTPPDKPTAITAITSANPPVVTANSHGRSNGDKVFIGGALAGGSPHASDGAIYTVANVTANTYELSGINGTGWAAYTGSGKSYNLHRSAPLAIFYGAGDSGFTGIQVDGGKYAEVNNVAFIMCGTKVSGGEATGLLGSGVGNRVKGTNVHFLDCNRGANIRDKSVGEIASGWVYNCGAGLMSIDGRYTFGVSNPGTGWETRTDTPLYDNCQIAVDIWEMASGHADGSLFIDCATEAYVHNNGHLVAYRNRYTNNGAAKSGLICDRGGFLSMGNSPSADNIFTGSYRPRYSLRIGSIQHRPLDKQWRTVSKVNNQGHTSGEVTQISFTALNGELSDQGSGFRIRSKFLETHTAGTFTITVKADAVTIGAITVAANASFQRTDFEFSAHQNGGGGLRWTIFALNSAAGILTNSGSFAFTGSADTVFSMTTTMTGIAGAGLGGFDWSEAEVIGF